jgi:hypothetical protein
MATGRARGRGPKFFLRKQPHAKVDDFEENVANLFDYSTVTDLARLRG